MTKDQYNTALKKLNLTPASQQTAHVLGFHVDHIRKFSTGRAPIPPPVQRILTLLEMRGGIPRRWKI